MQVHILEVGDLDPFLERRRATPQGEMSLAENLVAVLRKANEFVPSDAGSILLDNPREKGTERRLNLLTFVAAFGAKAKDLIGRRISASKGIAGHVYLAGRPYLTTNVAGDDFFYSGFDEALEWSTHSLVAIPIRIGQEVCGVLELINRRGASEYSEHDLNLLDIFAGYIAIGIQNVLDGRQAQEIARRDNLTGLFNDRHLHEALEHACQEAYRSGEDLALLFLDLDFFKRVNDHHGHLAGSQVLREVGRLVRRTVDRPRAILARYGGDEFVIALPAHDLDEAVGVAEDLRNEILSEVYCKVPGEIQPDPLHLSGLTASIGVATLRRHVPVDVPLIQARSSLLRLADAAMYVAKETGRNQTAVAGEPVRRRSAAGETAKKSAFDERR